MGWEKTNCLPHLGLIGGAGVGVSPGDCSLSGLDQTPVSSTSHPPRLLWDILRDAHSEKPVFKCLTLGTKTAGHVSSESFCASVSLQEGLNTTSFQSVQKCIH